MNSNIDHIINKNILKEQFNKYIERRDEYMAFIEFKKVKKEYTDNVNVLAVNNCSFEIKKGEFVVILGQSGAGKTTILNMLGGMDNPTAGEITVDGKRIDELSYNELIEYRRHEIGFVFQFYNLIANLTTLENVELACQLSDDALEPRVILELVGLEDRMHNFPSQLSGGEQQRVAIARAIAKSPKLLLCDEPTGSLDSETGKMIIDLLHKNCKNMDMTTLVITHNSEIAKVADKVITIKNGSVEKIKVNKRPKKVKEIAW